MEELTNTQFPQYEKGGHVQHNAIQRDRGILLGRMVQEHLPVYLHPLQDLPNLPLNHMAPSYWTASYSIPPFVTPNMRPSNCS
jgi:hypothetical protein